jgi:hypothetical protein
MDWVETFGRRKLLSKGLSGIVKGFAVFDTTAPNTSA